MTRARKRYHKHEKPKRSSTNTETKNKQTKSEPISSVNEEQENSFYSRHEPNAQINSSSHLWSKPCEALTPVICLEAHRPSTRIYPLSASIF